MPRSIRRRTVAAWAAAGVLGTAAVAGAVVSSAGAASASGTTPAPAVLTASTTPTASGAAHRPWRALRLAGIHGEFTVRGKSGSYVVLDTQRGTVTATTGTTLTVKSVDGFSATYAVSPSTKVRKDRAAVTFADVHVGDTVGVVGVKSGDTVTARAIRDTTG